MQTFLPSKSCIAKFSFDQLPRAVGELLTKVDYVISRLDFDIRTKTNRSQALDDAIDVKKQEVAGLAAKADEKLQDFYTIKERGDWQDPMFFAILSAVLQTLRCKLLNFHQSRAGMTDFNMELCPTFSKMSENDIPSLTLNY